MALYNNPTQNLSFNIPNEGELFRNSADTNNQFIFKRQGNQIFHTQAPQGFNVGSLQGYNMGDVGTAFAGTGKEANYRPFDPNLFSNASQPGQNVNVAADPNLQKYLGVASQQGVPLAQANLQGQPGIASQQTQQQIATQNPQPQLATGTLPKDLTYYPLNKKPTQMASGGLPDVPPNYTGSTAPTPVAPVATGGGTATIPTTGTPATTQPTPATAPAAVNPGINNLQDNIQRLIALQEQMMKAGVPNEKMADINKAISEQQLALENLTPQKYLASEPGLKNVGINEMALERRVAAEREPIAGALSKLLINRSYMNDYQQQQQQYVQRQLEGTKNIMELQQALYNLQHPKLDTEVVEENGRKFLINKQTGKVIQAYDQFGGGFDNLGLPPDIQKEVVKQNALDKQTVDSSYESIKGILAKHNTSPETLTKTIANELTDAEAESIGKALARIQQPDIARQGGDPGNALAPTGPVEKFKQQIRSIKGKKYLPEKIIDAVKAAVALQQGRLMTSGKIQSAANNLRNKYKR